MTRLLRAVATAAVLALIAAEFYCATLWIGGLPS